MVIRSGRRRARRLAGLLEVQTSLRGTTRQDSAKPETDLI